MLEMNKNGLFKLRKKIFFNSRVNQMV